MATNKLQPVYTIFSKVKTEIISGDLRNLRDIILRCWTADLGAYVDSCTEYGISRISNNIYRNCLCAKCQGKNREKWLAYREAELLPLPYSQRVFSLPDSIPIVTSSVPCTSDFMLGYSIRTKS